MKTINPSRPPHPCGTPAFFLAITIAAVAMVCTADTQTQSSAPIDALLSRLKSAIDQHEPAAHLGVLRHSNPNSPHLHLQLHLAKQPDPVDTPAILNSVETFGPARRRTFAFNYDFHGGPDISLIF
jgi:hypothetical protein